MKVVAIIQARVGSSRLPAKVLADIAGKSMLAHVVERTRRATSLHEVRVATTIEPADDAVVALARALGAPVTRGSQDDVLGRYQLAAADSAADIVVRITSDCPLIDGAEIDRVVNALLESGADYASNSLERTFPRGLDAEAFPTAVLQIAAREATTSWQHAHVTPFLYQHPERFRLVGVRCDPDLSHHRWTVDTAEDLQLVRAIHERLTDHHSFSWRDVLAILEREPHLSELNAEVEQKALHLG